MCMCRTHVTTRSRNDTITRPPTSSHRPARFQTLRVCNWLTLTPPPTVLHSVLYTVHSTLYTLHSAPYTLYTLHSYILHSQLIHFRGEKERRKGRKERKKRKRYRLWCYGIRNTVGAWVSTTSMGGCGECECSGVRCCLCECNGTHGILCIYSPVHLQFVYS